jgi:hypothetical protein
MADTVVGKVEAKKRRAGDERGGWVNFAFKVNGTWMGGFFKPGKDDGVIAEGDSIVEGDEVELGEVVKEGKYTNFKTFKILSRGSRTAGPGGSSAPVASKDYTYHLRGCMHMVLEMIKIQVEKEAFNEKFLVPGMLEEYVLEQAKDLASKVWAVEYEAPEANETQSSEGLKE